MTDGKSFERIFRTSLTCNGGEAWTEIRQQFSGWTQGVALDDYMRLRHIGPNMGLQRVQTWEDRGIRVKHSTGLNLSSAGWTATSESWRLSRLSDIEGMVASLDYYPTVRLGVLATFTFSDLRGAIEFEAPGWTAEEMTSDYRILSRSFVSNLR